MRKSYIAALDLGDSTMRLAVASHNTDGKITLEALVEAPSQGVRRGKIENVANASSVITSLLQRMQSEKMFRVDSMHVGLSGEYIRCAFHADHVFVQDRPSGVSGSDVAALSDRMFNVQAPEGEVVMERFAQNYMVDAAGEVSNPVGSFGRKLNSTYNFILCEKEHSKRVKLALSNSSVSLNCIYSNALSLCAAVTSEEERVDGVVVVDVGSELTDVTICQGGVVRYITTIPLGASAINEDLKAMMIPARYIEKVKCEAGNAISANVAKGQFIKVPGRTQGDMKSVNAYNVALAIEARATDIVELVQSEIQSADFEGKIPYMVLTGGSAHLKNLDQLFGEITGMDVRIGSPENEIDLDSINALYDPSYSALAGILIAAKDQECDVQRLFKVEEVEQQAKQEQKKVSKPKGENMFKKAANWFGNLSSSLADGDDDMA